MVCCDRYELGLASGGLPGCVRPAVPGWLGPGEGASRESGTEETAAVKLVVLANEQGRKADLGFPQPLSRAKKLQDLGTDEERIRLRLRLHDKEVQLFQEVFCFRLSYLGQ